MVAGVGMDFVRVVFHNVSVLSGYFGVGRCSLRALARARYLSFYLSICLYLPLFVSLTPAHLRVCFP